MSFVPASSNRDLLAALGVMVVAMLALVLRSRRRDRVPDAGAPKVDDAGGGEAR